MSYKLDDFVSADTVYVRVMKRDNLPEEIRSRISQSLLEVLALFNDKGTLVLVADTSEKVENFVIINDLEIVTLH